MGNFLIDHAQKVKRFLILLNWSENWLLATSRTNFSRIYEKLVKLSYPKENVNAEAAELQWQYPTILIQSQAKNE